MDAQNLLANSRVNITAEGKKPLGAVIESIGYRNEYVEEYKIRTTNLLFCQLLQKHNRKQLIQHLSVGLKTNKLLPENHSEHPPPAVTAGHICDNKEGY